jgi:hypothetical protein
MNEERCLRNTIVCVFIFWLFFVCYLVHAFSYSGQLVSFNEESQPLYSLQARFFPKEEFDNIRSTILASRLSTNGPPLMDSLTKASGTILSFNAEGEMDLRARTGDDADYAALFKFLDSVRVADSNAWVLQVRYP